MPCFGTCAILSFAAAFHDLRALVSISRLGYRNHMTSWIREAQLWELTSVYALPVAHSKSFETQNPSGRVLSSHTHQQKTTWLSTNVCVWAEAAMHFIKFSLWWELGSSHVHCLSSHSALPLTAGCLFHQHVNSLQGPFAFKSYPTWLPLHVTILTSNLSSVVAHVLTSSSSAS